MIPTTSRDGLYRPQRRWPLVSVPTAGRILSALTYPMFAVWPPLGYGVLITTGRRSGRARHKSIRAVRHGDEVYVVSILGSRAAWLVNVRHDPRVRLRIRGGTYRGLARELTSATDIQRAADAYCDTVQRADYVAFAVHRRGLPTPARIKDLTRTWFDLGIPLAISLTAGSPSTRSGL